MITHSKDQDQEHDQDHDRNLTEYSISSKNKIYNLYDQDHDSTTKSHQLHPPIPIPTLMLATNHQY